MKEYFKMYFKKWLSKSLLTLILSFCISFSYAVVPINDESVLEVKQKESISINEELSIKELFMKIENQTDYSFFYNSNLKELSNRVTINLSNAIVNEILDLAFNNLNIEYSINDNDILIRQKQANTQQQTKTVGGVVYDDLGLTLPGVNILVVGTKDGATTDFDGVFSLEVSNDDSLTFSFVGFKSQTVKVAGNTNFKITMSPEDNVLDEVIIAGVAAGTSRKKISISVARLNEDDINKVPQTSVSSALQGKIAGVTSTSLSGSPGSSDQIVLRGATSFLGSNSPMILIDGVIMQGSLADINVDDVENMEIVKGAAASSLYGSEAANGVIVITSKRGKSSKNGNAAITVRSETGFQEVAKYLDLSTSHHYYLSPEWQENDTYTNYYFVDYPADYVSGWDPRINGNRIEKPNHYQDLPFRVNRNLQKEMFTGGLYSTNFVSFSKSINKTNVYASFENNENQGVVIETGGYKRQSVRLNVDFDISENVSFSASNNYIKTSNDFLGGGTAAFFEVLMTEPDVDLFADNVDGQKYNFYPNHWNTQFANPIYDLWKKESGSDKSRLMSAFDLKWKTNDWLNFETSYAFERQDYHSTNYTPKGTIVDLQPNYLDPNANVPIVDPNNPINPQYSDGSLSKYNSTIFNQTFRATANFKKSWGELDFNGKLSYLYENNQFESITTRGSEFSLEGYPSFDFLNQETISATDYIFQDITYNYFVIASFVYKDRYIFDALYRNDNSSLFGSEVRSQNYFRVSGAYRISKDIEILGVQELKLRGAYGGSGVRPPDGAIYDIFTATQTGTEPLQKGNPYLTPSQSNELEIGLEASFLNRFRFEATYSFTQVLDQYVNAPLAAWESGFPHKWVNAGELQSKSIEAMLNANIINNENFKWDVTLTFDKIDQKITKLNIPEYRTGPRGAFKIREGEAYGGMYGSDFVRTLDQMEEQLPSGTDITEYSVNRDGVVVLTSDIGSVNEKPYILLDETGARANVKIGDINPDFRLGLNTNFSYKAFSFYMLWNWKQGGDIYNGTGQYLVRDNRHVMIDQIHNAPGEKKTVDYYQALYDAQALNGFWVEDASFVKLREASLYYTLNGEDLGKVNKFINQIRLGVIGRNLLTITDYTGYDPEAGSGGFVFDNFGYPNFRTYSATVQLKF